MSAREFIRHANSPVDVNAIAAIVKGGLAKADVGLSAVDNTSDAQKAASGPIGDALATLLAGTWQKTEDTANALIKLTSYLPVALSTLLFRQVSPHQFGAVKDEVSAGNDAAMLAFIAYVKANRVVGYIDGLYRISAIDHVWDFGGVSSSKGSMIVGGGKGKCGIAIATGGTLSVISPGGDYFYGTFADFFISGSKDGVLFRIGAADSSDAFNDCIFRLRINNGSQTAGNVAIELNYLCACHFDIVANSGGSGRPGTPSGDSASKGYGTAIKLNHVVFSDGRLSGGNAHYGMHWSALYENHSNLFSGCDIEEVHTGIWFEGGNNRHNRIHGKNGAVYNFKAQAGWNNRFNGDCTLYSGGALFDPGFFYGLMLERAQAGGVSVPTVPPSGTIVYNTTGRTIRAWLSGGAVTNRLISKRNTIGYDTYTPLPITESFVLSPGDGVTLTYSSAPAWNWMPVE